MGTVIIIVSHYSLWFSVFAMYTWSELLNTFQQAYYSHAVYQEKILLRGFKLTK